MRARVCLACLRGLVKRLRHVIDAEGKF